MTKPVKADSYMSLAADFLAGAAYWEAREGYSETVKTCIREAYYYADRYKQTWVYDHIYDPVWQAKEKAAIQQRRDAIGAGY